MDLKGTTETTLNNFFHHNILLNWVASKVNPQRTQINSAKTSAHSAQFDFLITILLWLLLGAIIFILAVIIFDIIISVIHDLLNLIFKRKKSYTLLSVKPLRVTEQSALATEEFFTYIHGLTKSRSLIEKILRIPNEISFEIVSQKDKGIQYIIRVNSKKAEAVKESLLSYLPGIKVEEIKDYIPGSNKLSGKIVKVVEFKLSHHFAYPLKNRDHLEKMDPIAYITQMMTKLSEDGLVSFQMVLSQTHTNEAKLIDLKIINNEDIIGYLNKKSQAAYLRLSGAFLYGLVSFIGAFGMWIGDAIKMVVDSFFANKAYTYQKSYAYQNSYQPVAKQAEPERIYNAYEHKTIRSIQDKIDQPLFDSSLRLLVIGKSNQDVNDRIERFHNALSNFSVPQYQSVLIKRTIHQGIFGKALLYNFQNRYLSFFSSTSGKLSVAEISSLYHFPFSSTAKTEDVARIMYKELPAPLSLKQNQKLDVIFGQNTYGGTITDIGLTKDKRETHVLILGRTGSGKTTIMYSMATSDIKNGQGLAFIDPHGDVAVELLSAIPLSRKDDLVYLNPIDLKKPIHINLLELTPDLDDDLAELEKEVVCEGVISLFRHVFNKEENTNAHRIEYILRNTIYTAFTVEDCTIFTIGKILRNPDFRKQVIKNLNDEELIEFWKYEFGKAGDYQVVKMSQGVTAKVGRFFRSPTAKRILEHPKSTINFDDIINSGKILICNLSQGNLGEDTSILLGTMILTKLQQAALKRANIPENKRKIFYLYVDEFQNFATYSFTKMITGNRKYKVPLIVAEQSASQQRDPSIMNILLANVTTVICFRTGNYIDEELMLDQFRPKLEKGDIPNLSRYHFYIKISAIDSEDPFSGVTIKQNDVKDQKKIDLLIKASRDNWGVEYVKPEPFKKTQSSDDYLEADQQKDDKKPPSNKVLPDEEDD